MNMIKKATLTAIIAATIALAGCEKKEQPVAPTRTVKKIPNGKAMFDIPHTGKGIDYDIELLNKEIERFNTEPDYISPYFIGYWTDDKHY